MSLALPMKAPVYLIGANNSGKSTVLNAVALVLRGGGFHTFTPEPFDFFHAPDGTPSEKFSIDLILEATDGALPAVQGAGSPVDVHRIRVTGSTEKGGRLTHRHVLTSKDAKPIMLSPRTPLKGDLKEKYKGQDVGWTQRYARPDDIRKCLPDVWLVTPENLERSLYHWKTGPLMKLSQLLSRRFFEVEWDFEHDGKIRKMPKTMESVHRFFRDAVDAFPFWKDELRPQLEDALSRYLGRQASVQLRPDIQDIHDWLAQQLMASFAADSGGTVTPLERMGAGWQALVRVAALDVLRKYPEEISDDVVLLYEEPETYLHPHLRRRLRDVLEDLAGGGWTVIAATHSPEFVTFGGKQQIHRLWRSGADVIPGSLSTEKVERAAQFQEKLDEHGNHEFLFASKAIFVEGKDDAFAIRTGLRKLATDLDGRGVSILGVGGVNNLPEYARMASELRIPWCAITDEDLLADGTVKPGTSEVRKTLTKRAKAGDLLAQWDGSLEALLCRTEGKAHPEWQADEIEPLSLEELRTKHPTFVSECTKVQVWIDQTGSTVSPGSKTEHASE